MKIRSQIGMVLNLDKCIGCHTCSITCKNVWTGREGMEYAWFNNVESSLASAIPRSGKTRTSGKAAGSAALTVRSTRASAASSACWRTSSPTRTCRAWTITYEPFDFDYQHLHTAPLGEHQPTARPRSVVSGKRMQKIEWGPNWEEILGTEFAKRRKDKNFDKIQADIYGEYENTFMMYLPRLCEHCLNPACAASCPSGRSTSAKRTASS